MRWGKPKDGRKVALAVGLGVGGLLLALWRRDIPYTELDARYAGPSSRFLRMPDGSLLHYRDEGQPDGPVLVCLHGFAASSLDWSAWAQRLGGRYRLILVDLPGHGLTAAPSGMVATTAGMVDSVAALIEVLGLARVVLVGNSMGGQIAWHLALDHPSRVVGLVLVASIGWSDRPPAAASSPVFRLIGNGAGRFLLRHLDLTMLVRRALRVAFGDARLVTPALVRQYTDLARAPGHRRVLTELQIRGSGAARRERLSTLAVPTLVMTGGDDRLVAASDAEHFAAAIPGASLITYPGVRHVPMQVIPDRSAADLDAWIATRCGGFRDGNPAG